MTLEELRAEETRLARELADVKQRIQAAREDAVGIHVGDIVMGMRDVDAGKQFKVTGIRFLVIDGKPWVSGKRQRPDGTFTTATYNLMGQWEKVPCET